MTTRTPWAKYGPALIIAAGVAVYLNSFSGVFLFDDVTSIEENLTIRQLRPVLDLLTGQRPLVNLSLAINYALGGLEVRGYHAFNLAVHLLAGLSLYGTVRRSLNGPILRERFGRSSAGLALTIALIWTVHPLQTQSVTYVSQRGESMMGLFYLLTLYCLVRGASSSRRVWWYVATITACTLGMASKPIMVTAPVMILIYDRVFLADSFRELSRRRWGLYGALILTWGILAAVGMTRGIFNWSGEAGSGVGFGYAGVTPLEYLLSQPAVILHYLKLSIWPHPLCLDYAWPVARGTGEFVFPGLAIVALLTAVIAAFRRSPWLGFTGVWFFIILAPTSSFVPLPDLAFEHRMYLSLAAVVTVFVAAAHAIFEELRRKLPARGYLLRSVAVLVVVAIVVASGAMTLRRNQDYRSAQAMWEDVADKRPRNVRAHTNLGIFALNQGRDEEAVAQFRASLRLDPGNALAHYNLGRAHDRRREVDDAYRHYEMAVAARPDFTEARNNLGNLLLRVGRNDDAIAVYRKALESDPIDVLVHHNLGLALERTGRLDEAVSELRRVLRAPSVLRSLDMTVGAHHGLARIHGLRGDYDEAVAEYLEILRIAPSHPTARDEIEALQRLIADPVDAGR